MPEAPLHGMVAASKEGVQVYRRLMHQAVDLASRWLGEGKLFDGLQPVALRDVVSDFDVLAEHGVGDEQALADAAAVFLDHALQVHDPLCIAHLHCPTTLASQLAEVLINVSNQSLDSWDQSPSATILELHVVSALRRLVGFNEGDAGVFTSGGTQSNLMGLLLARDDYVKRQFGVSVKECGLPSNSKKMVVLCASHAHFSIQQSLAVLGLGRTAAVPVPCASDEGVFIEDLKRIYAGLVGEGFSPFAVVATAGTTDTGAIDPLEGVADFARSRGLWLHVDAAWGGALLLSRKYRNRLRGLERADSITLDFHKHFFQPISCGAFLLRDEAHFDLMRSHADYLNPIEDEDCGVPNLVARSLQTTRRFDALKLWMSLRSIGAANYGRMIDHCIDLAKEAAEFLRVSPDFELVGCGRMASVIFRVANPPCRATDRDALHISIAQRLLNQGIANVGVTRHDGLIALKMTLINPRTGMDDVVRLLESVALVGRSCCAENMGQDLQGSAALLG